MPKRNVLIIVLVIVVIVIGYCAFVFMGKNKQKTEKITIDPKNCAYVVEGENVKLINGYSEKEIAGSASKIITKYFGNEVSGDFNNDKASDTAFLVTQNSGGSGTFYYLTVALGSDDKCSGTNAILLGDRIAPQTTAFQNEKIIVNYAERKPNEPMVTAPSVGVSKYFKVNGDQLIEVTR